MLHHFVSQGKHIYRHNRQGLKSALPAMQETPFKYWVRKTPWRRDRLSTPIFLGFPGGSVGKESACNAGGPGFHSWVGKIPWRRAWQPTQFFFLENPHGQRRLTGCSPRGHKELDMTEQLSTRKIKLVKKKRLQIENSQKKHAHIDSYILIIWKKLRK